MARNMTPPLKRCRALGLEPSVLGLTKKPSRRAPQQKRQRKQSEYGLQLQEKQKAKFVYGVLERQFFNYYEKARKQSGVTGENLMRLLELRLDNVIFRLGYARTRAEARQIVRHNHVLVNGKKVNIPSYSVAINDEITIKDKSRSSNRFESLMATTGYRIVPSWLSADHENFKGSILTLPEREQIDTPVNETLIIELYSK